MTVTTGDKTRAQRASRRGVSTERAAAAVAADEPADTAAVSAAAAKEVTIGVRDLDAGGGTTVTVDAPEIRSATGNTPVGTVQVIGLGDDGGAARGGGTTGEGGSPDGNGATQSTGGDPSATNRAGVGGGPQGQGGPGAGSGATTSGTLGTDGGQGGVRAIPPPAPSRAPSAATGWGNMGVSQPIVVREKAKALKLKSFRGLDDTMPITMWLKTVRAEVRRQAATMGVVWREDQLYHEVAAHVEGEAQRWFATVMETVPPEQENIETLASMLKEKYMLQRTGPEVVDLLNARRQMRGERLVAYAQSLREIAERGEISEVWVVNAFLKGMSSTVGATHVRGHSPRTLDDAVNKAISHVGEYGEGYGVGLEAAMATWDAREGSGGHAHLAATPAVMTTQEQSGVVGNFGGVVTGYGPMWGSTAEAPRYDTEGRPVASKGASAGEWWKAIPPGYQLVPVGASTGNTGSSNFRTSGGAEQRGTHGKRAAGNDQHNRRPAKALKVEGGQVGGSSYSPRPEYATREARLANLERYQNKKGRQQFTPRPGTVCFYCDEEGHFARDCPLKKADLAKAAEETAQNQPQGNGGQGNGQRA